MSEGKVITEITCLACALTLLIKAGELDEKQTNEVIEKEGYQGLYDLLNARYKEVYE